MCVSTGELGLGVLLPAAEGPLRRRVDQTGHPPPLLQQRHQRDRLRPAAHLRLGGVQQTAGRQKHQPAPVHLPSPKVKEERETEEEDGAGGGGGRKVCQREDVMIKERHHRTIDTS